MQFQKECFQFPRIIPKEGLLCYNARVRCECGESWSCAPVLLIGFNRPDFMSAQIAAVRAARPARLYVAVDGPRPDRSGEAEKCRAVRECVKLVDWPCEVKTLFREKNLGCKIGPSGAITWFFENEEKGIVLEDDCRPSLDFLRFASEMLERYWHDDRVGLVTGFNNFNLQSDHNASYHFSSHLDIWGWASWRRVWEKYDVTAARYQKSAERIIAESNMTDYFKNFIRQGLREVREGKINTWDFQFFLAFMANNWLSIVPRERLTTNAGIADENATHTGGYNYYAGRYAECGHIDFPLVHPKSVVCDEWADRRREQMEGAIFPRGLTWLGCKFPALFPLLSMIGRVAEKIAPILFRV